MSVLIKEMRMPKNCLECPLTWIDDDYSKACCFTDVVALNIGRQDKCPLSEVPDNHRLIDADALIDDCKKYLATLNPDSDGKECTRIHWLIGVLSAAAEGSGL